jgi:hypothetical protein
MKVLLNFDWALRRNGGTPYHPNSHAPASAIRMAAGAVLF